jgi:hypothetical protein
VRYEYIRNELRRSQYTVVDTIITSIIEVLVFMDTTTRADAAWKGTPWI